MSKSLTDNALDATTAALITMSSNPAAYEAAKEEAKAKSVILSNIAEDSREAGKHRRAEEIKQADHDRALQVKRQEDEAKAAKHKRMLELVNNINSTDNDAVKTALEALLASGDY